MNPVVRSALPSDTRKISELAIETYSSAFGRSMSSVDLDAHLTRELSPAAFNRHLGRDSILLAELRGDTVGFAQFGPAGQEAKRWGSVELRRLYVLPASQNRGIGTLLLKEALSHPALRDEPSVVLDVWERNERALQLYTRHGFKRVGMKEFHVESGSETSLDIVMVRRIDATGSPSAV